MASFNSALLLEGHVFPIENCSYEFLQHADSRGRASAKVRSGLISLSLVVPESEALIAWAADPEKKMSGAILFNGIDQPLAHEELTFEEGLCVAYEEVFSSDDDDAPAAYYCILQIAAAKLALGTTTKDSNWELTR
ncbi:type VI secretion system tube protein TssD [Hymenobacter chitinivorans]|uniref:Uncharacterized protein n=1 Tax=Hymenobacter chitinivorans DSM 11115 TaxID=1121954 RepID=A0A2M9BN31_9BACT|nr:type VI secretion system tube protein TssD [Hymenobacter chitinivorans]PJJ59368.1 hypothetical protein CLV45_0785 [Hymenobacter chitinivorans DSM 11115]